MKSFLGISLAIIAVVAEPPSGPVFIARYSATPQQQAPVVPYPISAARPQAYVLDRQQVPQTVYNPGQATTTEANARNSTEDTAIESTTEPQSEPIQSRDPKKDQKNQNQNEKLQEGVEAVPVDQGVYYLYHPTGLLQRIAYATSNDAANMAYVAQLKYQNVEPISEPIYTYDPETYVLQQIRV